jgi:hypothetical protein
VGTARTAKPLDSASRALHVRDEIGLGLIVAHFGVVRALETSAPGPMVLLLGLAAVGLAPVVAAHREGRQLTADLHLLVVGAWIAAAGGAVWTVSWASGTGELAAGLVWALGTVAATAVVLGVLNGLAHLSRLGAAEWEGPGDGRTSRPSL